MIHGKADQDRLAQRVRAVADTQETTYRVPDHDDVALVVDILTGPQPHAARGDGRGGRLGGAARTGSVFERFGRPPVALVPLVLDHNLRNTRQTAESVGPLTPMRMRALVADDAVERLLEEGWPTEHVALITTGTRHPEQNARQDDLGQEGYWRTFWENADVFDGHVLGCKGLERRAVVLCVDEDGTRDRSKERLYVGLSRATDKLVVVGDAAVIRAAGGDEIAKRLRLPRSGGQEPRGARVRRFLGAEGRHRTASRYWDPW